MARWHLKSAWSLSGRSLLLTFQGHGPNLMVIEAWSSINMFAFVSCQSDHLWLRWQIPHMTLKTQGQGHSQDQIWWSHSRPRVQSKCLFFVSWQSDHFWLRYSKSHIWPWKFKAKVMAKVKSDGHSWGLQFNWYVCFSFHGNRTIFGWDTANPIFDLEKGQGHGQGQIRWSYLRHTVQSMYVCFFCGNQQIPCLILKIKVKVTMKIDQNLIRSSCRSESSILPKMKEIRKFVLKLLREQKSVAGGGGVRTSM